MKVFLDMHGDIDIRLYIIPACACTKQIVYYVDDRAPARQSKKTKVFLDMHGDIDIRLYIIPACACTKQVLRYINDRAPARQSKKTKSFLGHAHTARHVHHARSQQNLIINQSPVQSIPLHRGCYVYRII